MNKFDLQPLRNLPIEEVAERVGLEVIRHKALCPFHDDHHASLSFNTRRNTYRCFVCDAHGGTIDLVMQTLHKDFRQACAWLSNNSIEPHQTHSTHSTHKPFDASRYERFFQRPYLSPAARKFLFEERQLDPRVVRWCRLTSWRDRDGIEWLQIPYYDRDGHLVGIQNRNLNYHPDPQPSTLNSSLLTPHSPRFRFPAGSSPPPHSSNPTPSPHS